MIFSRYLYILLVLSLLLFSPRWQAFAEDSAGKTDTRGDRWFLTLYSGASAQPDMGHVLTFDASFEDDTYIAVAALAKQIWRPHEWISFEAEGQIGKFFGKEHQWQFNGLIIGRWHRFPWDKYLTTTLAVGDGLSYNTQVSKVEKNDDEHAGHWLNYLMFELTWQLPKLAHWSLAARLHHRSSIKGLIGAGGSNYVALGVKYGF